MYSHFPDHKLPVPHHVREDEISKEIEKKRILGMKVEFEQLQADEEYFKKDFNSRITQIKSEIEKNSLVIKKTESENINLANTNAELNHHIDEIRNQIHQFQLSTTDSLHALEERYHGFLKRAMLIDDQHKGSMDTIVNDSSNTKHSLSQRWERKYHDLWVQECEMKSVIQNLIEEIEMLTHKEIKSKNEFDERIKMIEMKVKMEETRKYNVAMKQHENRLALAEDIKGQLLRKNQDLLREQEHVSKSHQEELLRVENDVARLKIEISETRKKNSDLVYQCESYKNSIKETELQISKYEAQINELQRAMEKCMEIERDQLNDLSAKYSHERKSHDERRDHLHRRINDLEKLIRSAESQLHKMKIEYGRIMELLTESVKRTISQTMSDHRSLVEVANVMTTTILEKRSKDVYARYPELTKSYDKENKYY